MIAVLNEIIVIAISQILVVCTFVRLSVKINYNPLFN